MRFPVVVQLLLASSLVGCDRIGPQWECADPYVLNDNLLKLQLRAGRLRPSTEEAIAAGVYRSTGVLFAAGLVFGTEAAGPDIISDANLTVGEDLYGYSDFADTRVCRRVGILPSLAGLVTPLKSTEAI